MTKEIDIFEQKLIEKFSDSIITTCTSMSEIMMTESEKKLESAKNHPEIFKFLLNELLILINKKKISLLYKGKYLDKIDNSYFNYLKNINNFPEDILESVKKSYHLKYDLFETDIIFEDDITQSSIGLILNFLYLIDNQKGTNYESIDKEVEGLLLRV